MAKKSRNPTARPNNDNAGCMSSLISMFDFRQGHFTQKLLSDRKRGSGRYKGTKHSRSKIDGVSNLEESREDVGHNDSKEVARGNLGKANIKALMVEEMSKAHTTKNIPNSKLKYLSEELGFEADVDKNDKMRTNQNLRFISDHDVNDLSTSQSACSDPSESSTSDANLTDLILEFFRENHKYQETHICDKMKDFLTKKSIDSKRIIGREFMDTLETHSNKDKFLKLLQDPNSHLFKHILELQNTYTSEILRGDNPKETISCQLPYKQNRYNLFSKKGNTLDESASQALKRKVILKPRYEKFTNQSTPVSSPKSFDNLGHRGGNERVSSHFSLKEIKRRLRNVVGESKKKRDLIAMDGILHKIPYGFQSSVGKNNTSMSTKQGAKLYTFLKREDDDADIPYTMLYTESIFYEEAKKRLAEKLSSEAHNDVSSPRQVSKPLARILSLPGYDSLSPRFSPQREINNGSSTPSIETSGCSESNINSNPTLTDTQLDSKEDLIQKDKRTEFNMDELGFISERIREERCPMVSDFLGPLEENTDRPSPVSVLDPLFSEDSNSSEKKETAHFELISEPRKPSFEEQTSTVPEANISTKLKYVQTVLQASGLNYNILFERWKSSDQLLDPFVFNEVEIQFSQLIEDSKLLFDCINEVLVVICEKYSNCTPWISFIKPDIRPKPKDENFEDEVCKGVDCCLHKKFPCTLDQIARKDLECRSWMNVGFEIEGAINEIEELVLDYIMEETILELWE